MASQSTQYIACLTAMAQSVSMSIRERRAKNRKLVILANALEAACERLFDSWGIRLTEREVKRLGSRIERYSRAVSSDGWDAVTMCSCLMGGYTDLIEPAGGCGLPGEQSREPLVTDPVRLSAIMAVLAALQAILDYVDRTGTKYALYAGGGDALNRWNRAWMEDAA